MKIKTIGFLLILIFGLPLYCNAAPSITSTSGVYVDGESISITGSDFGAHSLNVEWLGGTGGHIESGNVGDIFSKAGWITGSDSGGFKSPRYSDDKAHSHSKSIKCDIPTWKWSSAFSWDNGRPLSSVYVSWWVYLSPLDDIGYQWKVTRISPTSNFVDIEGEIYMNIFYQNRDTDFDPYNSQLMVFCNSGQVVGCYPDPPGDGDRWLGDEDCVQHDRWARLEWYAVQNSSGGTADGTFVYFLHQNGRVRTVRSYKGNLLTRDLGVASTWRFVQFQNTWGTEHHAMVYIDDVYIQTGTQARVEIGDNAIWDNCTYREIQIPSAWSNSSITITANQGSFTDGETAYLFVVDADGNVNTNGYPIVIGGGGGTTAEINATPVDGLPDGLTVAFSAIPIGGATISNYSWSFGDGSTSTAATPQHTYASGGNKAVTLTATIDGTPVQVTKTIDVFNLRITNAQ